MRSPPNRRHVQKATRRNLIKALFFSPLAAFFSPRNRAEADAAIDARFCGIESASLKPILVFFLALHDLGKFSESFQNVIPELLKKLQGIEKSLKQPYARNSFCHGSNGFLIWSKWLFEKFAELVGIGEAEDKEDWSDLLKWFMEASTGLF